MNLLQLSENLMMVLTITANTKSSPQPSDSLQGCVIRTARRFLRGDIFKTKHNDWEYIVTWQDDNSRYLGIAIGIERQICYVGMCDKNGKSAVEVIGNIWGNSDLIGGESNGETKQIYL